MNVYLYQAALLCASCGERVRDDLQDKPQRPTDYQNESTYDSDDYPKGPYSNGGGEADTPQHCDHCGVFLENPLTPEGESYVKAAFSDDADWREGKPFEPGTPLAIWAEAYPWVYEVWQKEHAEAE